MLYSLHVKDLALIKEQEIEFGEGLNVLTGETGAGKSVLIGSVNLALGSKADKDLIRTGADYALVELTFFVDNEITKSRIKEMDLPIEEDETVILSRKIMDGRSICKVGGENVTVRQLRLLGELLINIHGQNDNQTLLQNKKHLEILDSFAGDKVLEHKKKLKEVWSLHEKIKAKLEETDIDEATRKLCSNLKRSRALILRKARMKSLKQDIVVWPIALRLQRLQEKQGSSFLEKKERVHQTQSPVHFKGL